MADGESTPKKTAALKPAWQPGQSGNPAGRPKGARNRFAEAFINDFLADWEEHGAATIAVVRAEKPDVYVRTAAVLIPKEYNLNVNDAESLSDAELDARLAELEARADRLARGAGEKGGDDASAAIATRVH